MKQNDINNDYSGLQELLNIDEALTNYNKKLVKIFYEELNIKEEACNVMDFGAGIGTLSQLFYHQFNIKPICVEIDTTNIQYLKRKKFQVFKNLDLVKCKFDYIFSSNVLEHIQDDLKTIKLLSKMLKKNGKILFFVPAHKFLFSQLDISVGHYRRYAKKELVEKCSSAGLKILKCNYFDSIGLLISYIMKYLKYDPKNGLGNIKSLKIYDKFIFPVSMIVDEIGFDKIIGKNLIIICSKDE